MTEHGDMAGYWQHRKAKDPPCSACREAYNAYKRAARSPRHSSAGDDETVELNSLGRPVAAYAGYYATDGYGLAIAQMDESGHWLDVDRAIYAPMTYRQSQRPPESFEAPPLSAEETAVWKERCRAVMRGELLVTEGELGEAVELTEAQTGEVVWAAVS